jgi:hypothetical protein
MKLKRNGLVLGLVAAVLTGSVGTAIALANRKFS